MGNVDGNAAERLRKLELDFSRLRQVVERYHVVTDSYGARRNVRLAKTRRKAGAGSYPSTGNTFPIIFLDASYTEDTGSQTLDTTDRNDPDDPKHYVRHINGLYLAENTLVQCWEQNEQWFTSDGGSAGRWVGKTTSAMSGATDVGSVRTPGSGSVQPYQRNGSNQLETSGDPVTVYNPFCAPLLAGEWVEFASMDPTGELFLTAAECACE